MMLGRESPPRFAPKNYRTPHQTMSESGFSALDHAEVFEVWALAGRSEIQAESTSSRENPLWVGLALRPLEQQSNEPYDRIEHGC